MRPPCAPKGARSERRGALHDARGCACAARRVLVRGRCCASKRARAFTPSCRASIVPHTATTRRLARPLARRRCSEPSSRSQPVGRHASAVSSEGALRLRGRGRLRGVRQPVQAVDLARECAPERATRERSRFQSASVCVCGHSRGACSRPRTNATVIVECLLASWDQRRHSQGECSRPMDQRNFFGRMRVVC